jgi:hypothetical protein
MSSLRLMGSIAVICLAGHLANGQDSLRSGFLRPPDAAKIRAYWWWLNGNVTKESIKRDLEEMKAKGFGGALICDANGAEQFGNSRVPHGPTFFTPEWRELYKFTLREAKRLGLEMSLNIQSGWNLGGPMVKAEDAPKKLVWSSSLISGPVLKPIALPKPKHAPELYGEVAVVAYPIKPDYDPAKRATLSNWEQKSLARGLSFSAPSTSELLQDKPDVSGEEATQSGRVLDLTSKMDKDGVLHWEPPPGKWEILRIGYTLNDHCRVSTCSDGWDGYAIDPFDRKAFQSYWDAVVEPLIADAGSMAGTTLKYLHTDSWEVEVANWTPTLRAEFRKRRGYDLWRYLPVMAGRIVDSRSKSNRLLHDLRRTIGDLAIDNHYKPFKENARRHKLLLHPESGGPHAVPIDSLQCLGMNDAPMSEFWATSWMHRVKDEDRFFVKQPASAAHTYGHQLVFAEGFTTIGPHWQETLWDNLKPNFDEACCQGMNMLVWHAFVCSPDSTGIPGQQYFAGTHLNPKVTWWEQSMPFFDYLNRCQFLLQKGRFVADALYYYGNHVPNFTQLQKSDPAKALPGYDYDVATEEVILTRLKFSNGRLVLPDGMSYRVLVLPNRQTISLPVLKKVRDLAVAGATVIGPKPTEATTLTNFPNCDVEVKRIADELWGTAVGASGIRQVGKGRVIHGLTAKEVLASDGVPADFSYENGDVQFPLNYIHRKVENADVYFVANRTKESGIVTCYFRVTDKVPELWDPMSGQVTDCRFWEVKGGRTVVPIEFSPCGSTFVVFRKPGSASSQAMPTSNFNAVAKIAGIEGPWEVRFDPKWGGPAKASFDKLIDWTTSAEPDIRFYSGTARYRTTFDLPNLSEQESIFIDLGEIRELAEVLLNGKSLGIVWAPPFRVSVGGLLKKEGNILEVRVTNFWPNRIIGDASLPENRRLTRTNILKLTASSPLMPSGLLGPVQLVSVKKG